LHRRLKAAVRPGRHREGHRRGAPADLQWRAHPVEDADTSCEAQSLEVWGQEWTCTEASLADDNCDGLLNCERYAYDEGDCGQTCGNGSCETACGQPGDGCETMTSCPVDCSPGSFCPDETDCQFGICVVDCDGDCNALATTGNGCEPAYNCEGHDYDGGDCGAEALAAVQTFSASQNMGCAINISNGLSCWRFVGNLALGWTYEPLALQGDDGPFAVVSVTQDRVHAVGFGGELYRWDGNGTAQLVTGLEGMAWTSVAGNAFGSHEACGIHGDDGQLSCWGWNEWGELVTYGAPEGTDWQVVSIAGDRACGLHGDQALSCWSAMEFEAGEAVPTPSHTGWTAVSAGGMQACGIHGDGELACWWLWGESNGGAVPTPVGAHWASVTVGDGTRTCGVHDGGVLSCWEQVDDAPKPVLVNAAAPGGEALPGGAIEVTVEDNTVCALYAEGELACWTWQYEGGAADSPYLIPLPVSADVVVNH
jgi:hypothetical protein